MTRGPSPAALALAAVLLALTLAQASAGEGVIRPDATVSFLSAEGRVLARIQAEIADDPAAPP
jgi:hypothetical protein